MIYLACCLVLFPLAYAIPFYLFSKIYKNFRENKDSMSDRARQLHQALNRALISQVITSNFISAEKYEWLKV
jgi:hypothetical protein